MNALVGYTGFVGSNILKRGNFDAVYNSKNIDEAYGTEPDLLVYSGLRAEKFLANNNPLIDMEIIEQAKENIRKINAKKLVLISTIDVFKAPFNVDEKSIIDTSDLHPYGYNRYMLEVWVRENYSDALIIRLPALFGDGIKKNFLYDYITKIPSMLNQVKYQELSQRNHIIAEYYKKQNSGFYKVEINDDNREVLLKTFDSLGFNALNFTDSRSRFQFYNLANLWDDINTALNENISLWHPATEPVSAAEIYEHLCGENFVNELSVTPAAYDYRTIYDTVFGGANGYICDKNQVLEEIRQFVNAQLR